MTFEAGKVYTFKFNSGEEMIAKVSNSTTAYIEVTDPLSIAPNKNGMGLIPSLFTSDPDKSVMININSVAMHSEVEDSVRMKYTEATTGIQMPEKKILVG